MTKALVAVRNGASVTYIHDVAVATAWIQQLAATLLPAGNKGLVEQRDAKRAVQLPMVDDKYADDKYADDMSADDQSADYKYAEDRHAGAKSADDKSADSKYAGAKYAADEYADNKNVADKYADDKYADGKHDMEMHERRLQCGRERLQ